jgi:lipid-binding SYLF domain-containing protein
MNINTLKLRKRSLLLCLMAGLALVFSIGWLDSAAAEATKTEQIDADADKVMERLNEVQGGTDWVAMAKALLIMPSVGKGALIIGFEHGKGALRIGGQTVDYYSMSSGSVGLQIGGESKDIVIGFMTTEALEQFRTSKNWEAGIDGNIAMVAAGSGGALTNISGKETIQAVVFDVKGLFLDFSLKGGKFSKLDQAELNK